MKILIIEDDDRTAQQATRALTEAGHVVDRAPDGREGLFLATGGGYDVIVLDRMLPGLDGLAVLGALRGAGQGVPVLILSALAHVDERVRGLKAGGDDYLSKPFAAVELVARVEALGRRPVQATATDRLVVADLEVDLRTRRVTRAGRAIDLRPQEYRLLEFLMRHEGQVVTRAMLYEGVWDFHFEPQTNVVEVHVSRLRQKIDRGFGRPLIRTHRGGGYSLGMEDIAQGGSAAAGDDDDR